MRGREVACEHTDRKKLAKQSYLSVLPITEFRSLKKLMYLVFCFFLHVDWQQLLSVCCFDLFLKRRCINFLRGKLHP